MPPKEFKKWANRYRCMPDYYYDGGPRSDPGTLTDAEGMSALGHIKGAVCVVGGLRWLREAKRLEQAGGGDALTAC